jgi:hypothetical protein
MWYVSLLSAGSISKKKSDSGFPVTLSLTPTAQSGVDFLLPLCKHVVAEVGLCGAELSCLLCLVLLCDNPIWLSLRYCKKKKKKKKGKLSL